MKAKGWNYEELAAATENLTRSGVYKIVQGKRWPSSKSLDELATALEVEIAVLFSVKPMPQKSVIEEGFFEFVQALSSIDNAEKRRDFLLGTTRQANAIAKAPAMQASKLKSQS